MLAQQYGLDCDQVYQRQWQNNPHSVDSIHNYLVSVVNLCVLCCTYMCISVIVCMYKCTYICVFHEQRKVYFCSCSVLALGMLGALSQCCLSPGCHPGNR